MRTMIIIFALVMLYAGCDKVVDPAILHQKSVLEPPVYDTTRSATDITLQATTSGNGDTRQCYVNSLFAGDNWTWGNFPEDGNQPTQFYELYDSLNDGKLTVTYYQTSYEEYPDSVRITGTWVLYVGEGYYEQYNDGSGTFVTTEVQHFAGYDPDAPDAVYPPKVKTVNLKGTLLKY